MSGNSTHTEADSREDNLPLSQQSNVSNFIEEEGSEDSRPSDGESRRKRRRNTELDDGVSDDEGGTVPHSSGVPQMSLEELQHLAELATQPSDVQLCKPSKGKIPAKPKNMTVKQSGAFDSSFVEFEELSCQKKPTGKKKADTHKACRDHVAHLESLATELLDGASRVHSSREKQWSNYADDCENEIVRLSDFNSNQYTRAKEISKERDVLQKKFSKLEGQSKSTIQSQKYEITGLKAKLASELKMVGKLEQQVKKLKAELEEEKSLETPRDLNNTKSSAGVGTNDLDDYERKRMIDLRYYEEKTRVDVLKKEEAENKKLKAKHSRMQQVQSSMSWMSSSGGLSGSGTGMFSAPGMTNMMHQNQFAPHQQYGQPQFYAHPQQPVYSQQGGYQYQPQGVYNHMMQPYAQPYPQQQQQQQQTGSAMQQQQPISTPHAPPLSQQCIPTSQGGAPFPPQHQTGMQQNTQEQQRQPANPVGHTDVGNTNVQGPPPTYAFPTPNAGVPVDVPHGGFRISSHVAASDNDPAIASEGSNSS